MLNCARAQDRVRGNSTQTPKRKLEEGVVSTALDRIKISFSQSQQGKIAFENLVVGDHGKKEQLRDYQSIDVKSIQIFDDERQPGIEAEVVRNITIYNKIGHGGAHIRDEQYLQSKSLNLLEKIF